MTHKIKQGELFIGKTHASAWSNCSWRALVAAAAVLMSSVSPLVTASIRRHFSCLLLLLTILQQQPKATPGPTTSSQPTAAGTILIGTWFVSIYVCYWQALERPLRVGGRIDISSDLAGGLNKKGLPSLTLTHDLLLLLAVSPAPHRPRPRFCCSRRLRVQWGGGRGREKGLTGVVHR